MTMQPNVSLTLKLNKRPFLTHHNKESAREIWRFLIFKGNTLIVFF